MSLCLFLKAFGNHDCASELASSIFILWKSQNTVIHKRYHSY
uniref:Uncharacterized protein n=1 Tax=Rhizophora mucronata TaxID=61149 RepID=A0A2P2NBP4_RHIMU